MHGQSAASGSLAARRAQRWPPGPAPGWALPALLVGAGYYLAVHVGLAFTPEPYPISMLWPPNALLLAALLLTPTGLWWILLAAALPAHLLAELQGGVPVAMVLGWYASNCSEALIGAALVRAFVAGPLRLDSLRSVAAFLLCAALAAPLASSFLDAALVRWIGWGERGYWDLVSTRFFANVLAELIVGPLILAWAQVRLSALPQTGAARRVEAAVLLAGLLGAIALVFAVASDASATPALFFYAALPFLLWAAMRLGMPGIATGLAIVAVAAIWGTVRGLGPFANVAAHAGAREVQLLLAALAVPLLLFTAALAERRRLAREAREQREQLTHLSRVAMLGELSGGIAHELNQPLTAILSNAQAAQHFIANKSADPQLLAEILQDIITADQRAGDVIRRLHALFKRGETQFQTLDVNALVREVLRIVNGDLVMRSIELVSDLAAELEPVEGDRVELQQVMLNLVMNACEAMSTVDGRPHRLTVSTRAGRPHGVLIGVTDNGTGFPPEQYERMFEPFYTTKRQGLGLGLSISRAMVAAHGGRLWGRPNPGHGATFYVFLPGTRQPG
jgi:signal transduction histidine kinase